jgi:acetyl-CoA synthetase
MATAVEQPPQVPQELRTSAPESLPKSAIPAAVASPVLAPAATETVSLRAEETPAPAQETKAPVVAEAHLVDTYRKFAQPTWSVIANFQLRPSSAHVC